MVDRVFCGHVTLLVLLWLFYFYNQILVHTSFPAKYQQISSLFFYLHQMFYCNIESLLVATLTLFNFMLHFLLDIYGNENSEKEDVIRVQVKDLA